MNASSDRRDQAIKAYNDRVDAANQKIAEREASVRAQEVRRQKLYVDWLQIADTAIPRAVVEMSETFVNSGSPIILVAAAGQSFTPQRQSDKASNATMATPYFDVRHKGQPQPLGRLQFEINVSTGKIGATTTIKGVELPQPILIDEFKPEWVAAAAEAVLLAVLESADAIKP